MDAYKINGWGKVRYLCHYHEVTKTTRLLYKRAAPKRPNPPAKTRDVPTAKRVCAPEVLAPVEPVPAEAGAVPLGRALLTDACWLLVCTACVAAFVGRLKNVLSNWRNLTGMHLLGHGASGGQGDSRGRTCRGGRCDASRSTCHGRDGIGCSCNTGVVDLLRGRGVVRATETAVGSWINTVFKSDKR